MPRFKSKIFILLLVATGNFFPLKSQPSDSLSANHWKGWSGRGKIIYGFVFEDWWMFNFTFGAEYRWHKNHAIGIDYIFFEHFYEQEQYNYPNNPDRYDEYRQKLPRHALLVDYKLYVAPLFFDNKGIKPYVNMYCAAGKAKIFSEEEYKFDEGDIAYEKEKFADTGLALGFRGGDEFGIDVHLGARKRFAKEDIEYYRAIGSNQKVTDYNHNEMQVSFRVNLFMQF